MENPPEWLDGSQPPPVKLKPGFYTWFLGKLGLSDTSAQGLSDLQKAGVSTTLSSDGKSLDATITTMIPPEKK